MIGDMDDDELSFFEFPDHFDSQSSGSDRLENDIRRPASVADNSFKGILLDYFNLEYNSDVENVSRTSENVENEELENASFSEHESIFEIGPNAFQNIPRQSDGTVSSYGDEYRDNSDRILLFESPPKPTIKKLKPIKKPNPKRKNRKPPPARNQRHGSPDSLDSSLVPVRKRVRKVRKKKYVRILRSPTPETRKMIREILDYELVIEPMHPPRRDLDYDTYHFDPYKPIPEMQFASSGVLDNKNFAISDDNQETIKNDAFFDVSLLANYLQRKSLRTPSRRITSSRIMANRSIQNIEDHRQDVHNDVVDVNLSNNLPMETSGRRITSSRIMANRSLQNVGDHRQDVHNDVVDVSLSNNLSMETRSTPSGVSEHVNPSRKNLDVQQSVHDDTLVDVNSNNLTRRSNNGTPGQKRVTFAGISGPLFTSTPEERLRQLPANRLRNAIISPIYDKNNVPTASISNSSLLEIRQPSMNLSNRENRCSLGRKFHVTADFCVNSTLFLEFNNAEADIVKMTPEQRVLYLCNPKQIAMFTDVYDWSNLKCTKIGEGSFGEVFSLNSTNSRTPMVVKIIPIVSKEKWEELLSELIIARRLNDLRNCESNSTSNFVLLQRSAVALGNYPKPLLDSWYEYKKKNGTYNKKPSESDERYALLEFEYGGTSLENFEVKNAEEALSIFYQTTCALAVAEERYLFEHRDLHADNILITRDNSKVVQYIHKFNKFEIASSGLHVQIIDFNFSRLEGECIIATDLETDESLFNQSGELHCRVYKEMRNFMKKDWRNFVPYTNVLWLHYLAQWLLTAKYKYPKSKKHLEALTELKRIEKNILSVESAAVAMENFVTFL